MEIAGFDRLKATAAATVQTDLQKSAVQAQTQREDTMRAQRVEQRADNEAVQNEMQSAQTVQAAGTAGVQAMSQAQTQAQNAETKEDEQSTLAAAREQAREYINSIDLKDYGLSFSVEKDLDKTLISVTDRTNDKVIRQIPSEEFVQMARNIREFTAADDQVTTDSRGSIAKNKEEAAFLRPPKAS